MGLFNEDEVVKTPSLIPSLDDAVVSIASGGDHIVLVTLFGKVSHPLLYFNNIRCHFDRLARFVLGRVTV